MRYIHTTHEAHTYNPQIDVVLIERVRAFLLEIDLSETQND